MQAAYHYLRLLDRFPQRDREVTLEELSAVLSCSVRNVRLIVKQLAGLGWVEWKPGKGRGHYSKITLLAELSAVVSSALKEREGARGFSSAIGLLGSLPLDSGLRTELAELLGRRLVPDLRSRSEAGGRSDSLVLPFYRELPNLDPLYASRRTELHMAGQLYDNLVRWDGERRTFLPALAIHWEREGTEWRFILRKGVKFHDKREFTSADARYTIQQAAPMANWAGIIGAEAPDPNVLVVRTETPCHVLLHLLASPQASVVPDGSRESGSKPPIGTGPFKLARNDSEVLVMEAFEDYYRERAQLDSVEIWILKELIANRIGDDSLEGQPILYEHPFQIHGKRQAVRKGSEIVEGGSTVLCMNGSGGRLLGRADRRRLLARAIDPGKCVEELGGSRIGASRSFFPEWSKDARGIGNFGCDRAEGEASSEEWTKPLLLLTHPVLNHSLERTAGWIRKECAASGIPVEVRVVPDERWDDFAGLAAEADLLLFNAVTTTNREADLLRLLFDSRIGLTPFFDADTKAILAKLGRDLSGEPDPDARMGHLRRMEEVLEANASLLHLYHLKQTAFYHPKLLGTDRYNPYGWIDFRELALKPELS
mgnify:CR=1 FL=1